MLTRRRLEYRTSVVVMARPPLGEVHVMALVGLEQEGSLKNYLKMFMFRQLTTLPY